MRLTVSEGTLRSLETVERQYRQLGPGMWYIGVGDALTAQGRVFVKAMKARAPSDSGRFKRRIRVSRGYPRFEPSNLIRAGRQQWILRKGTKARYQRTTGRYTGRVKPDDFADKAMRSVQRAATQKFAQQMSRSLQRIVRQLEKGNPPRRVIRAL